MVGEQRQESLCLFVSPGKPSKLQVNERLPQGNKVENDGARHLSVTQQTGRQACALTHRCACTHTPGTCTRTHKNKSLKKLHTVISLCLEIFLFGKHLFSLTCFSHHAMSLVLLIFISVSTKFPSLISSNVNATDEDLYKFLLVLTNLRELWF